MRRCITLVGLAFVTIALAGAPAGAHVTVNPDEAEQGGFAKLTFRVPTERGEPTTKLEVVFPEEQPLPFLSVQPVPGWEYAVEFRTLDEPIDVFGEQVSEVVDRITWQGGEILPGEFQEFSVSGGPLPEADRMQFAAIQTYGDGATEDDIVRWIQDWPEGAEEPEFPAPILRLVPAEGATTETTAAGSTTTSEAEATTTTAGVTVTTEGQAQAPGGASQDDVDSAKGLAIAGLVVAILALGVGIVAVVRRRASA
jgi:uncharacterized protein YcnI